MLEIFFGNGRFGVAIFVWELLGQNWVGEVDVEGFLGPFLEMRKEFATNWVSGIKSCYLARDDKNNVSNYYQGILCIQ